MGDECVYGVAPDRQQTLVRLQSPQLSTTGFSLRDLRFFHSFLTASYPSFPFETDRAWTCEIPVIAQQVGVYIAATPCIALLTGTQYGFLNDAILALGAGHLHATTNLDIEDTVHRYRSSAIRGINSEDNFDLPGAKDLTASDRATAVLAAIYALAFTSLHMGDPIGHFMVLVRGCSSVTRRIVEAGLTSPLFPQDLDHVSPRPHMEVMRKRLGNASPLPAEVTEAARASLGFVEMSCDFLPFELDFLHRMQQVVAITSGPIEGEFEKWSRVVCNTLIRYCSFQPLHRAVESHNRHGPRPVRILQRLSQDATAGITGTFPGIRNCATTLAASHGCVRQWRQQAFEKRATTVPPGRLEYWRGAVYAIDQLASHALGTHVEAGRGRLATERVF